MTVLCIVNVPGVPVPQGSVVPMLNRATGRPFVKAVKPGLAQYRGDIREEVGRAWPFAHPVRTPVSLRVEFNFPRPKGHFNAKGEVKPSAPRWPTVRPDVDKVLRAVLDSLTGLVYEDDAQVVRVFAIKQYATFAMGRSPSTSIIIEEE